jgi:hypothetical protein
MIAFPIILIIAGLVFLFIHKKLKGDIERLDANYTGDIVPDPENDAWHRHRKKIIRKNARGSYYMGLMLIFWGIAFLIVILMDS